jgi:hypothetical protein
MPITTDRIERLEKLLTRTDLPVQKKQGFDRNQNRISWVLENFDKRNRDHPKRDEILELCKELLS